MNFGETIILKSKEFVKLIKIGCKNDKESYCVIGDGKLNITMIMMMLLKNSTFDGSKENTKISNNHHNNRCLSTIYKIFDLSKDF